MAAPPDTAGSKRCQLSPRRETSSQAGAQATSCIQLGVQGAPATGVIIVVVVQIFSSSLLMQKNGKTHNGLPASSCCFCCVAVSIHSSPQLLIALAVSSHACMQELLPTVYDWPPEFITPEALDAAWRPSESQCLV